MLVDAPGSPLIAGSFSGYKKAKRGNPSHAASKAGAVALMQRLVEAWAGEGVRVNGIVPGFAATKMTAATMDYPTRREAALAHIPAGRMGLPDDIAHAALFLASPRTSYIVGHMLAVDGGLGLTWAL